MNEVFTFVMDMDKEKLASPGDEIHLSYRVQIIKNKEQFSMSKIVASTE